MSPVALDVLHAHQSTLKNVYPVRADYFFTTRRASQVGVVLREPMQITVLILPLIFRIFFFLVIHKFYFLSGFHLRALPCQLQDLLRGSEMFSL